MLLRVLKWLVLLLLTVLAMAVVGVAIIDWAFVKGPIESNASRVLGRQVTIAGDIDVKLALHPRVIVRGIRVANADWSKQAHMLEVEKVTLALQPIDWLTGTLAFAKIHIEQPRLLLERGSHQRANWQFAVSKATASQESEPQQSASPIHFSDLLIADASIDYRRSELSEQRLTLTIDKLHLEHHSENLALGAEGKIAKQPFNLRAAGGTLEHLLAGKAAYPIRAQLRSETTQLRLQGDITDPLAFDGIRLEVALEGKNLSRWSELAGMQLPHLPVFDLTGTFSVDEAIWQLTNLQSNLEASDLGGDIFLHNDHSPPLLEGKLRSSTLDVTELQAAFPEKDAPKRLSLPPLIDCKCILPMLPSG